MKLSVAAIAAIVITSLLMGCAETSNPVSTPAAGTTSSVSILDLPASSSHSLGKVSDPVVITPEDGGVVTVTNAYTTPMGTSVSVTMKLTFDAGTVTVPTTVTIALDDRKVMADFSPSGTSFQKPVHLDADVTGLNLSNLPASAKLALYYLSGSTVEKMDVESLKWDAPTGTLQCRGGMLPHFSIYGFGFTK
jgi:hypothetical protein